MMLNLRVSLIAQIFNLFSSAFSESMNDRPGRSIVMQLPRLNIAFCALTAVMLVMAGQAFGQSRDIRQTTEEEMNREINQTPEERAKARIKVTPKTAQELYYNGNFRAALDEFLILLAKNPTDPDLNFFIGACYLESNIDKKKAIQYLEFAVSQPKYPKEAIYQLGRAYMFAHRFDEAITTFNKYKDIQRGKEDNIITGTRMIEMCFTAKELVKYPRDVTFENLGININTAYPEYNPFIPEDESFIVFTTKRPDCLGLQLDYDGYKTPDIYRARTTRGRFAEARNIGSSVNTEWYEECVGLSADGQELLVYIDNFDGYDDIYNSPRKGRFFDEYYSLGPNINTDEIETTASMSTDGQLLFLTREVGKGVTGTDIYMSRKLPNGTWAIPTRLPDVINTRYNEAFPHLADDGKTLYFASEGHMSMGGFDIFTSEYDELTGTWSVPRNVGYPINTVDDDFNISMSTTGRYGYISQFREEGYGERDIYMVTFKDTDPIETIVRGSITNIRDSLKNDPRYEVGNFLMTVRNMDTDEFIGYYRPNKGSSNYAMVLEPGDYCVYVEGESFFDTSAVIEVLGRDAQVREQIFDYTLRPDPNAKRKGKESKCQIYALSGSVDGMAKLWEVPSGRLILNLDNRKEVSSVQFSPNGKYAAASCIDGSINLWNLPDGTPSKTLYGHKGRVNRIVFTPNNRYIVSCGADSTVRSFDLSTGKQSNLYIGHVGNVNDVTVSSDGNYLITVSDDGNVLMWDFKTTDLVGVFDGHSGPVRSAMYSPCGNYMVTGGSDGKAIVWNISTAKPETIFSLHGTDVTSVRVSPDCNTIVSTDRKGFTYSWDRKLGSVKNAMPSNQAVASSFISKDSRYIITGGKEKDPRVWAFGNGDQVTTLYGHKGYINDVAFSPCIKFPEKEMPDIKPADPKEVQALEAEVQKLEEELAKMEQLKKLGYDPSLLDVDIKNAKKFKVGDKIILERIYFDFDKYNIRDESVVQLNQLLLFLTNQPNVVVEISGHTDSRGTDDYNEKLSRNRAKSVVAWLGERGIPSKRTVAKGYGERKHIAPNENPDGSDNPEGRQMNRRIELTIIGVTGEKIITTENN